MVQTCDTLADFSYDAAGDVGRDAAGLPARVSIFADSPRARRQMIDDLEGAGLLSVDGGVIGDLLDGPITRLGDVVLIEVSARPQGGLDGRELAALSRLDMRIARSGAQLIVSTVMDALDDVFAVLDQSRAQILVQPSRAERIVAVGRVMANVSNSRVREMSEEDRLNLLHLSQQVEAIAHKLEGLSEHRAARLSAAPSGAERQPASAVSSASGANAPTPLFNSGRPALPDPKLVRQMIAGRQARARFFDAELFADPAWDMLLDLTAAHAENARVSVTS
ncbi:MAG: MarR family transcriptional regulator, partial [Pseudomonadota bacterium]